MRILIVDDEPNIRRTLRVALESMGHAVEEGTTRLEALRAVEAADFDLAFVDLRLGDESGLDRLEPLIVQLPRLAVVVITAHAGIDTAIEAMRRWAFDYLPKPFTPAQVRALLMRVAEVRGLRDRISGLQERVRVEVPEVDLRGRDDEMGRLLTLARKVAQADAPILIRGENGTGKGVLARAIHDWAGGQAAPSSRSVVLASVSNCWRATCSGTSGGRSRGPSATPRGRSRRPRGGRSFSMRSATCRRRSSRSTCGSSRSGSMSAWERPSRGRPTSA